MLCSKGRHDQEDILRQRRFKSLYTEVIHAGAPIDPVTEGISVPIYQSSTFPFRSAEHGAGLFTGAEKGFIYTRLGNPTIKALEDCVASLERGFAALATASGMAAISTVYMAYLDRNAHMIGPTAIYGASRTVIENEFSRYGVEADFVDASDIRNIEKRLRPNTRLIFIETPANPTLAVTDIRACARLAHERGLLLVADNTFCSPIVQRPIELGADIVVHSLTKFLNGHADVVGGIIVARTEETFNRLKSVLHPMGGTMDPHQAWLVLRGIKTLAVRMEKCQANALKLAMFLESHPKVRWVNYPGLESHLQHDLVKRQMDGFGAMICFGLKGGFEACKKMINSVKVCTLAVSLGGVESLIQHPASMTHSTVPKPEREEGGITDDLIRFSVGCEGFQDLRDDLEQALAQA